MEEIIKQIIENRNYYMLSDEQVEAIKKLEEEKKINLSHIQYWYNSYNTAIDNVKRLEKEIEELQSDNYELNNRINDLLDSVPKSVIEEKIEEVQKEYEETLKKADFKEITTMNRINFEGIKLEGQRTVLQELLEKGNK